MRSKLVTGRVKARPDCVLLLETILQGFCMSDFRKHLDEQLKEEFKKEWGDSEVEYNLVRSLVAARKERHMTQKELAENQTHSMRCHRGSLQF